ncbi:MAG: TetR/AcrR family transcriptional regulator [Corynebacterium sp.]|nr:TetR/AcrR family transcriptional regulator [Corynebacterium sp.]
MATAKKSRRDRPAPRERLLASATNLFATEGIRVIGIDRILREADVAKASLYSLFGSKDNLIIAYLERLDATYRASYDALITDNSDPLDKLIALFDTAAQWQTEHNFRGSYFTIAAGEYPKPETDSEHKIVAQVMIHRAWLRETVEKLLLEKNGYPGGELAEQIIVLYDGAITGSQLSHDITPLEVAKRLVRQLVGEPAADYSI